MPCSTTGRSCDGYETSLLAHDSPPQGGPKSASLSSGTALSLLNSPSTSLELDAEECRGFAFFRERTVFEIKGAFRSSLWEQIALQISQREPAVLHAAVAVGIVHRDQSATQVARKNAFYHGLDKRQCAGLKQYVKAIEHLRIRIDSMLESGIEEANEVAMMCCLLFVCLELLWGRQMTALTHLGTGLKILTGRRPLRLGSGNTIILKPRSEDLVDQLLESFARLDFESTMFGQRSPHLHILPSGSMNQRLIVPSTFESLSEARRYMDILSSLMLRFRGQLLETTSQILPEEALDPISRYLQDHASTRIIDLADHPALFKDLTMLRDNLAVFSSALKTTKATIGARQDTVHPLILLELQHFYAHFLLSTCQTTREILCDTFNPLFEKVVHLSKQYLALQSTEGNIIPVFALDSGIIPALYLTAYKCRCPRIRREAISLMNRAPCQEGMWDGKLVAKFMTQVVKLEESRAGKPVFESSDIGEEARCSDVLVLFHTEKVGWGRLLCASTIFAINNSSPLLLSSYWDHSLIDQIINIAKKTMFLLSVASFSWLRLLLARSFGHSNDSESRGRIAKLLTKKANGPNNFMERKVAKSHKHLSQLNDLSLKLSTFKMVLPVQVLHVYYKGMALSVLDSDEKTCIYTIKCLPLAFEISPSISPSTTASPVASSSFSILTTNVKLLLHSRAILLHREKLFTRSYTYTSPGPARDEYDDEKAIEQKMHWEAEDLMSGDFKLMNESGQVFAWFRNKVFSTTELGRFEIMRDMEGREVEVLLTGLAMLAMVQSGKFGLMVIGGS
ncbi:hypothetical protein VTL71DRAFT_12385 [Oculimacula yallundae]|uniref:Spindle pole body component n=1 Tax=Oculimacula yallundae TaxID=86028 RepID=A0ABR4CMG4_9HELO